MGKAFSLLYPPQPPQQQREGEGMGMELRKNPRPKRFHPDFVSSPPPTPPRKRPRKQGAERRPRRAPVIKPPAPSGRAGCGQQGIGSPVAGLQPSRCCRIVAPLSRASFPRSRAPFNWHDPDIWTEVAKHLHGTDLLRLSATCLWFRRLLFDDTIWRYAFLRNLSLHTDDPKMRRLLHVPRPFHRSWRLLYAAAFEDTHACCFRQPEKHIEWFRIGGFLMDTSKLLLTAKLALPPWMPITSKLALLFTSKLLLMPMLDDGPEMTIGVLGSCLLTNVCTGIWIADMNMVRCPVCNLNKCEGTMHVLDARHCELYLENKFRNGTWEYEDLGSHFSHGQMDSAAAAIFNRDHINTPHVKNIQKAKWIRDRSNLLPKACFTPVAVALSSNLKKPNSGLLSKFQAMRDMTRGGQIVSVRITQQLL